MRNQGKEAAEAMVREKFPNSHTILKPSVVYGSQKGAVKAPHLVLTSAHRFITYAHRVLTYAHRMLTSAHRVLTSTRRILTTAHRVLTSTPRQFRLQACACADLQACSLCVCP